MELLQLKYFCDAAETENFSRTAQSYHIPPSAVSQAVKRLETELGVSLFDRTSNKLRLNARGRLLYEHARQALSLLEEAERRLRDKDGAIGGEIKLLVSANRRLLTAAIERFREAHPDTVFRVDHRAEEPLDSYDIIISDDLSLSHGRKRRLLIEEDILLAVEQNNPLARAAKVRPADLSEENFVSMNESSRLGRILEQICRDNGFAPRITVRSDDPFYVRQYVALSLGITLVPSVSWQGLFPANVVLKSIGDHRRYTYAFWHEDRYISRAVALFLETLEECCRNIGK